MVNIKALNKMKSFALISVYNKSKLNILCDIFKKNNIGIISTGSTSLHIRKLGYKCITVDKVTKFKEILEGRVKSLHPHFYVSILFNRNKKKHLDQFTKIKIPLINYVIVNLYPFEKLNINKNTNEEFIEMIDIGGHTLLRASAKNYAHVNSICDPKDYKKLIQNIKKNKGKTDIKFREKMAAKIFLLTSNYDLAIHNWIQKSDHNKIKNKEIKLRYGENPHQKSYLIKNTSNKNFVDNLIQGKNLSFNNIKDSEAGFNCINEFKKPTSVIIKHSSPCGVASSTNILIAFKNSIKSDPISSFGGVIVLNRVVGKKIAFLISKKFYEIILAPKFTKDAIKIMGINKNLRLIKTQNIKVNNKNETYSINGGHLIQEKNKIILNQKDLKLKTKFRGDINIINQLIFAYKVSKYVKSNAIVLVYNDQTLSISGG